MATSMHVHVHVACSECSPTHLVNFLSNLNIRIYNNIIILGARLHVNVYYYNIIQKLMYCTVS